MPFKSEAQRRAMYAAAEGHSTLGIPKSVGEKFVEHGKKDSTDSPKTELDIARAIRDGELSSPQVYENVALFDLRITGTGLSKRDNPDEWVLRPEENFLTDEFVERCNGLPVVFEHPEDSILSTDEYRERAIGTIILPYLKGTEVRGIAKIFDQDAANLMMVSHISTSPGVVFRDDAESVYLELEDGERVVVEGVPSYIDHLAICRSGVWDKGEQPNGVNRGEHMDKKEEKKEEDAKKDEGVGSTGEGQIEAILTKILERMDAQDARIDAMAKKDEGEIPDQELSMDASEKGKTEEEEEEHEASKLKKEGESEEKKIEKEEEMRDAKKDEKREKNGEFEKSDKKDSKKDEKMDSSRENLLLKAQIAAMQQKFNQFTRELTPEERDQLGSAQRRADSVFQMLGEDCPAPLAGERPISYRKRLAARIQKYSDRFGSVKLDSIDGTVYDEVERNLYEDAKAKATSVVHAGSGKLIAIREPDASGMRITTRYIGDSKAGLVGFSAPGVTARINRDLISKGK